MESSQVHLLNYKKYYGLVLMSVQLFLAVFNKVMQYKGIM